MTDIRTPATHDLLTKRLVASAVGVLLGMLAFSVDLMPTEAARWLTPLTSSGAAWGLGALVVSLRAQTIVAAVRCAITVLTLATLTYYFLILTVSQRWTYGDGNSGFGSLVRSAAFWLVGSLVAGAIIGSVAYVMQFGQGPTRSIALGAAFGMLAGEAVHSLLFYSFYWVGPIDSFAWHKIQAALVQLAFALASAVLTIAKTRRPYSWLMAGAGAVAALFLSVVLWHAVWSL